LFKNTLFIKIIFVFLFPAFGMLYFNLSLVYDKLEVQKQSDKIQSNIKNIKSIEDLIHSLQKERGLSSSFISSQKFKSELSEQRTITNKKYQRLLENNIDIKQENVNYINNIKELQSAFSSLELLRINMDQTSVTALLAIEEFNSINELLLETISLLSRVQLSIKFDNALSYINNLLIAKEKAGIERALTVFALSQINNEEKIFSILKENYIVEDINIKEFLINAKLDETEVYKKEVKVSFLNEIRKVRDSIHNDNIRIITIEKWWDLSTAKIDALENVYKYVSQKTFNEAKKLENSAYLAEKLSIIFLLVTIFMILVLLFLLRQIVLTEQKSILKIKKQQNIYKLLNSANKFLIKSKSEKKLYNKISELMATDANILFSSIYKRNEEDNFELLYEYNDSRNILRNNSALFEQIQKDSKNIVINDFESYRNIFDEKLIRKYKLKSLALFPIKRFSEIMEILVIFSNEKDFFDKEVEILFDNMVLDISHALEKIYYEIDRKIKEDELRIVSYAFETNEPMLITDSNAKIINANKAFCNVMGYEKEEILGKNPAIFKSKYHEKDFYLNMWKDINNNGSWSGELYNKEKNKQIMPLLTTITAVKDNTGEIKHYLAQYINISEQKDKQKLLEYHATHDYLTDLPNRLLLLDRIEHAVEKVVRHDIVGGLIFIDLDNFKEVNDTLGHEIGDKLLIEVSKTLKNCVRNEDTVSRIGGDEFIILSDCIGESKEDAKINIIKLANKIKLALNSIEKIDGHKNIATPSIGVTLFSDNSISVTDIIKQADTAMYQAKKQGKNSIELFE